MPRDKATLVLADMVEVKGVIGSKSTVRANGHCLILEESILLIKISLLAF